MAVGKKKGGVKTNKFKGVVKKSINVKRIITAFTPSTKKKPGGDEQPPDRDGPDSHRSTGSNKSNKNDNKRRSRKSSMASSPSLSPRSSPRKGRGPRAESPATRLRRLKKEEAVPEEEAT